MNEIYHDCVNMIAQNWQIDKSDVPEILAQWCVFEQKHGQFSNVKLKIAKSNMDFWNDSPWWWTWKVLSTARMVAFWKWFATKLFCFYGIYAEWTSSYARPFA